MQSTWNLFFSTKGRIGFSTYWFSLIVIHAFTGVAVYTEHKWGNPRDPMLFSTMAIATAWPGYALAVKRVHDRNRSGWFLLLLFIPIINLWPAFELLFGAGTPGENRFGRPEHDANQEQRSIGLEATRRRTQLNEDDFGSFPTFACPLLAMIGFFAGSALVALYVHKQQSLGGSSSSDAMPLWIPLVYGAALGANFGSLVGLVVGCFPFLWRVATVGE